jgi:undecaprenyl-diphosphatase
MNTLQAFLIAILEGLTEYLPFLDTAHMVFLSSYFEFKKTILSNFSGFYSIRRYSALYWKNFSISPPKCCHPFYLKLIYAVIPALILGKLFDKIKLC